MTTATFSRSDINAKLDSFTRSEFIEACDIPDDLQARTDAELDRLNDLTEGVFDISGPCGLAHYDSVAPVSDELRHRCELDLSDLSKIAFDCRGDINASVETGLRETAQRLLEMADRIRDRD